MTSFDQGSDVCCLLTAGNHLRPAIEKLIRLLT